MRSLLARSSSSLGAVCARDPFRSGVDRQYDVRRLLLGCGCRAWPDIARAAAELALYPCYELMHGACPPRRDGTPGGDEALDRAALAAGYVVDVTLHRRPADWDRYYNGAGPIRNRAMAAECKAILDAGGIVDGLALGALKRADDPSRKSGTGDMVALLRALGVRVRWAPAPDAEAQTLACRVYSARCGHGRDPDDIDVTRAHGNATFAPSWDILNPALEARRQADALRSRDPSAAEAIEAAAWAIYVPLFVAEMRASFRARREDWRAVLALERVVLRCRCADAGRCHRRLLRQMFAKLGAVDMGELPAVAPRQLTMPGL